MSFRAPHTIKVWRTLETNVYVYFGQSTRWSNTWSRPVDDNAPDPDKDRGAKCEPCYLAKWCSSSGSGSIA
jgi:hypothetical protein